MQTIYSILSSDANNIGQRFHWWPWAYLRSWESNQGKLKKVIGTAFPYTEVWAEISVGKWERKQRDSVHPSPKWLFQTGWRCGLYLTLLMYRLRMRHVFQNDWKSRLLHHERPNWSISQLPSGQETRIFPLETKARQE